tara:strand:- start:619 stop:1002 length:384 start_codon:yes stop_codon:yes gene_type:complete
MEFFKIVAVTSSEEELREKLQLKHLDRFSNEFFSLEEASETNLSIGGIWGEFTLSRSLIKGGLRFALDECPNALCWTVTAGYPPARDAVVIHLTINRQQKQDEFLEEIEEFLSDHQACLKEYLVAQI